MPEKKTTNREEIRQVMCGLALEYFHSCGICPTLSDLIKTSTMLEEYCVNGYGRDMIMKFDRLDDYINQEYVNADKNIKE
jgi:hypothetical protein